MKQLIIGQSKPYASGVTYFDITQVPEGAIGIFNTTDGSLVSSKDDLKANVAVVCGRGENKMPLHFPEVDVRSLTVQKATYQEGKTFEGTITVPTPEKGKSYTVIVVKVGTVFNEREKWSFDGYAKTEIAADVAKQITDKINANTENLGVTAEYSGGTITITATKEGNNYEILGADELMGVEPEYTSRGVKATCDKAYIQDLASRCAAGKGFNLLAEDGKEIYPGYPEVVDADKYVLYTLRFAVPRVASKQRDEVVYQLLHIAVPEDAASVATLDSIFGVEANSDAASVITD